MIVKELRIGNYIQSIATKPVEIMTVDIDVLKYLNHGATHYKPIKLTEEWLKKFGFEQDEESPSYRWRLDTLNYVIYFDIDDFTVCIDKHWLQNKFEHVHELQNLYHSLTGEELTIKP